MRSDARTHGHCKDGKMSPTYKSWSSMKSRCYNPKTVKFEHYGGKGIKVCDHWLTSFENFLADMGVRPLGLTLDRYPNKTGNYEPGNCRWATKLQQTGNQTSNRLITHNGKTLTLAEWERESGLSVGCVCRRLRYGWNESDAVTKPMQDPYKKKLTAYEKETK